MYFSKRLVLALLAALLICTPSAAKENLRIVPLSALFEHDEEFRTWAKRFGKTYSSDEEWTKRLSIWIENHELINQHNAKGLSFKLGHNQFSDLTNDEFQQLNRLGPYSAGMKSYNKNNFADLEGGAAYLRELESNDMNFNDYEVDTAGSEELEPIPDSLDWRSEGAVTQVKDQGQCGSCWAFSATGSIEGANFIKHGNLVALSEQELLDCDGIDYACDGGFMTGAYLYLMKTDDGLCSEDDYPYVAWEHLVCRERGCLSVPGSRVVSFTEITPYSVDALLQGIATQPVSVSVEASRAVWQFYESGVLASETCGHDNDHAVLAVGYGTDEASGLDYFLVKNSWGTGWGEDGYIRLSRESETAYGTCGILEDGFYPTVL